MSGINDTLLIGILLILIFGAVSFYLYSRLSQTEKRMSLMENLLLALKMNTEASLMGPESIEPISGPMPLNPEDVDAVEEEDYAELLKEIPEETISGLSEKEAVTRGSEEEKPRSPPGSVAIDISDSHSVSPSVKINANYESMTVKELQALAKQRGISGVPQRRKELLDALKKSGSAPDVIHPLGPSSDDLDGATVENGFIVGLDS